MIKNLDGWDVAAHVRFVRQVHKGTILILEGETDDRALSRFLDPDHCIVEISFGKKNAIQALDLLEEDGFPGVLAVVDADFDRIQGEEYELENLCITDCHDLDLTIFSSRAFEIFVNERADRGLLKKNFDGDLGAVRKKVLDCARPLGALRLVSSVNRWRLYFKGLSFDFVDRSDLTIGVDAAIKEVYAASAAAKCKITDVETAYRLYEKKPLDEYQLIAGHDAATILGLALREMIAGRRDAQTWGSEIEAGLRLAFDWEALSATKLYQCLLNWEHRNKPKYHLFRAH